MSLIDNIASFFKGKKDVTQGDVLAEIRRSYPQYESIDDATLATAVAKKKPEFSFLATYDAKKPVSPEVVPSTLRDDAFYKSYPDIGKQDALKQIDEIKIKYPAYKDIEPERIAQAMEEKRPDLYKGISARLNPVQSNGSTEKLAAKATEIVNLANPIELAKRLPFVPKVVAGNDENMAVTISKSLQETVSQNPNVVKPVKESFDVLPDDIVPRTAKGLATGVAGVVESTGGAAQWFGAESLGKSISDYGQTMREYYKIDDPKFYDQVTAGFGSLSTFFIPGLGISKGLQVAAFAPQLASWLGVGASSVLEAIVEAGATYQEEQARTDDPKKASLAANKTFWGNLPLLVFTNKFGLFGENGGALVKGLKSASGEAVQEFSQTVISNIALKDPTFKGALESGAVGFITGGGVGAITGAVQSLDELRAAKQLKDQINGVPRVPKQEILSPQSESGTSVLESKEKTSVRLEGPLFEKSSEKYDNSIMQKSNEILPGYKKYNIPEKELYKKAIKAGMSLKMLSDHNAYLKESPEEIQVYRALTNPYDVVLQAGGHFAVGMHNLKNHKFSDRDLIMQNMLDEMAKVYGNKKIDYVEPKKEKKIEYSEDFGLTMDLGVEPFSQKKYEETFRFAKKLIAQIIADPQSNTITGHDFFHELNKSYGLMPSDPMLMESSDDYDPRYARVVMNDIAEEFRKNPEEFMDLARMYSEFNLKKVKEDIDFYESEIKNNYEKLNNFKVNPQKKNEDDPFKWLSDQMTEEELQEEIDRNKKRVLELKNQEKIFKANLKPSSRDQENGPNLIIAARAPSRGQDALFNQGAQPIDTFEKINSAALEQDKIDAGNFKLFDETRKIVHKYAERVGEKYLPRGARGVFYPGTDNIRVNSLNNISTAAHEVTHYLDKKYGIFDALMNTSKADIRNELAKVYLEYYPTAAIEHSLEKKTVEGIATFFQKTIEQPTVMRQKFPNLYNAFFKQHGSMYKPVYTEFVNDVRRAVKAYQDLDPLQKVGARITEKFQQSEIKDSYLNLRDKFVTEIVDNVFPIEKLAKEADVQRTSADPSLWIRANNNSTQLILNNLIGKRGFWSYKGGEFRKTVNQNIGDLFKNLRDSGVTDEFGHWLVARRAHFDFNLLDKLQTDAKTLRDSGNFDAALEFEKKAKDLGDILQRDAFDRKTYDAAYTENQGRFKSFAEIFDQFTQANLEMLREVGLITPEQFKEFSSREGYASFKRDVYDDIIGADAESLPNFRVGGTKVSSTMKRKGSELTIINPLYSLVNDHSEIMRKSMKQLVYNKIYGITSEFPQLFQRQQLKVNVEKETGKISYPQEKDPNIMMARDSEGKRIPLLVSKEIKGVIDGLLAPQNIHIFERLVRLANRLFVKGTTGIYPLFAPTNFIVDQITSSAQTRTKMIPIYTALAEMQKVLFDSGSQQARFFEEYMALGGERQTLLKWQDMGPEELFEAVKSEKKGIQRVTDALAKGLDILSLPNQSTEIMTRATEYIRSRMAGNPQVVALEDAGRVSVPFHHIGRLGGGTVGQTAIRSIPFMNPGIQALAQYYRAVDGKDTRARALFVTLVVTAALIGSAAWLREKGTEDQLNLYKDLEPRELAMYLWFPAPDGKTLLKVRIPEQMGIWATMVNMVMANYKLDAKYSIWDIVHGGTEFLPDQFDVSDPARAFFSAIPQLLKPIIGVATNTRDFPKIRPLVSRGLQFQEPRLQFHENTSDFAKWIGDKLNVSPIKVDYLIEGYLGRTARFVTGKPISNPFVRDWYFTAGRNLQDYYEIRESVKAKIKAINDGQRVASPSEQGKLVEQAAIIKQTERLLDTLKRAKKTGSEEKYEEEIRGIRRAILDNVGILRD